MVNTKITRYPCESKLTKGFRYTVRVLLGALISIFILGVIDHGIPQSECTRANYSIKKGLLIIDNERIVIRNIKKYYGDTTCGDESGFCNAIIIDRSDYDGFYCREVKRIVKHLDTEVGGL